MAQIPNGYGFVNFNSLSAVIPAASGSTLGSFVRGASNVLCIIGASGRGKTQIACSLLCEIIKREHAPATFVDALRYRYMNAQYSFSAFRRDSFDDTGDQHVAVFCEKLILDDIDEIEDRDLPVLARILNTRSDAGRITIVTVTDEAKLKQLPMRTLRRISSGSFVRL